MDPVSRRAYDLRPFLVMDVLERAQALEGQGRSVVHLEIGEPDFATPAPIVQAAQRAMAAGMTHYTSSLGILPLREAIARHYESAYGVPVSPGQVVVTSGTSPALLLVLLALLDPGDEVIMPNPRYPCYPNFVAAAGGRPVDVPVEEGCDFALDPAQVRARWTPRTKAVLLASPGNPTGTVMSAGALGELAETVAERGGYLIVDEIYHGLTYEGRARSALEVTDRAFVIDGFSKRYAMTGWRLGYAVVPPDFVRPIQKLQQNLFICANAFVQHAGVAALEECGEHVAQMAAEYNRRRLHLLQRLNDVGLPVRSRPTGAFYVFVDASRIDRNSHRLAFDLLNKAGVAVAPGIDFGSRGEGFLRLSYAASIDAIDEGMERLAAYLAER